MGETSLQHAMPAPHLLCTLCGLSMHIYLNGMTAPEHNAIVTSVTNHTDTWIQFRELTEGPEKQFPFQEWVRALWRVRNEPRNLSLWTLTGVTSEHSADSCFLPIKEKKKNYCLLFILASSWFLWYSIKLACKKDGQMWARSGTERLGDSPSNLVIKTQGQRRMAKIEKKQ